MYSFCFNPFKFQPSGNVNFSKIEKITFEVTQNKKTHDSVLTLYALGYNLLEIKNGCSVLLYNT